MLTSLDLQAIFDASPNPYMLLDRELRYVAANEAYLRVTSRTREELLGRNLFEVFPNDPGDPNNANTLRLHASLKTVLTTRQPDVLPIIPYRIAVPGAAGISVEERFWSATHTPILDELGEVKFILQHTVNVTELQQRRLASQSSLGPHVEAGVLERAEQVHQRNVLLDSTLRYLQEIFRQAPVAITLLGGPSNVIQFVNPRMCQIWGRSESQVIGRPVFQAMPDLTGQGLEQLLADVRSSGKAYVGNEVLLRIARAEGGEVEDVYVTFIYQPLVDREGPIESIVVVATEVTNEVLARKKAERAEAELRALFESFPEAVYAGNQQGIQHVNAAALKLFGYDSAEEMRGEPTPLVSRLSPKRADNGEPLGPEQLPFTQALRGHATKLEVRFRHRKTGEERTIHSSGAPIRSDGVVTGAAVAHVDITERKRMEDEQMRLAKVLDATRDFVAISTLEGARLFLNGAGRRLLGIEPEDRAESLRDYFAPSQRTRLDSLIPAAVKDGYWEGELRIAHFRTQEEIPVLASLFPLRDRSGQITTLAIILRDLRAQKAAEAERARLLQNEKSARSLAEEANRLKDEFLATVSHELRTPLTAMLGWLQMLKTGVLPPERRTRALETVERNARAQAQLVDDLLDVSRIVSGKLALEMEPTDITSVVSAAIDTVRPTAEARGVALVLNLEAAGLVMGDAHRLQQIVWNLLSNAVKFTPKGGTVTVTVVGLGGRVEISVQDTGAGIPPDFLPHVFDRFRQAEGGTTRKMGGLGLGLSIVRHLVEAHAGEVEVFSEGPGHGATFRVHLPITETKAKAARGSKPVPMSAVDDAIHAPPGLAGMRVLLVDDEEDTREYVRALLQRCDAKVSEASNAAEALNKLKTERPDLLVSDIGMPVEDGYGLIRKVRGLHETEGGKTPAIALTAYARSEDRTRALLAGFQNHVTKPIEPVELLAVVASFSARV